MKHSIEKNRARMYRASLETLRYATSALMEMLDAIIADASSSELDQKVAELGGGDDTLIGVLDDAIETALTERNYYIDENGLERGAAVFKVKEAL
ncbi:MAG TPA: hypothetical protein VE732_05270 [Nitrososphaera sp.]|nr:hypothetical protein [Nitrososphaera sp.]